MTRLPLIVLVLFGLGLAMALVVVAALILGDMRSVAVFGTWAGATTTVAVMVTLALRGVRRRTKVHREAAALVIVYVVVPAIAALPLVTLVPDLPFEAAYFEMMSALTTTGATVFPDPDVLPLAAHFWRSIVAWLGGYLILVVAFAIMAPLNIGGFELITSCRSQ